MTPHGFVSSNKLWRSIRREAEAAIARDPVFGASMSAAILDHGDLGGAVAFQIGERLARRTADGRQFAQIAREAFLAAPGLVEAASRDLRGIADHDPATSALLPPLLNFKGFVALQAFRVSNWLWSNDRIDLALLLQSESSDLLQVSIHPSARIGTPVFLDHATGIVVGAFVEIGDEVTIMQNVTIGRKDGWPAARRGSAGACWSPRARLFWATSASATLPRSARRLSSRRMYRPDARPSACRRA